MTQGFVNEATNNGPTCALSVDIDTVIIGDGPAALFLSFLLHGNVPYYDPGAHGSHPDPILHRKLSKLSSLPLYEFVKTPEDISYLTEHFPAASPLSYSSQAQPINVLLDTLLRPNGDLEIGETMSRIRWEKDGSKALKHLVLGAAPHAGGQWSQNSAATSLDFRTLSYADMLSLPGYTFFQHYMRLYGEAMPFSTRPRRRDVSSYYSSYPNEVGISSSIGLGSYVHQVERTGKTGFLVRVLRGLERSGSQQPTPYVVRCRHLVLASGTFTRPLAPALDLQQIQEYGASEKLTGFPLLVIGSGFTAADVILSANPNKKIIHIFKWDDTGSSPLKGCHPSAYPEYAAIYKRMRLAAVKYPPLISDVREQPSYEALPNAEVISITPEPHSPNLFSIQLSVPGFGITVVRQVGNLSYCVGRRGDLSYLSPELQAEVGVSNTARCISGDTLRTQVAADVEIAKGLFAIGSLTGDSLVKYSFGSGTSAAGKILSASQGNVTGGAYAGEDFVMTLPEPVGDSTVETLLPLEFSLGRSFSRDGETPAVFPQIFVNPYRDRIMSGSSESFLALKPCLLSSYPVSTKKFCQTS